MVKYETVRFDPTPGEVVDLISEAVEATNRRCRTRLLEDNPVKWRKAARKYQNSNEGWEMWRAARGGVPATQVMVSWWTDLEGRKHTVIRGRRAESYGDRHYLDKHSLGRRPALWHCYPDRMYSKKTCGTHEWVVVCDCGAAGTPESIGWMGTCCGPCHDRAMELGETRSDKKPPSSFFLSKQELMYIAVSPDETWVAGTDNKVIHLRSIPHHSQQLFRSIALYVCNLQMSFSIDSNYLIPQFLILHDELNALKLNADPVRLVTMTDNRRLPRCLLPWIDGSICHVCSDGLVWIDPETKETLRETHFPIGEPWQVIPSDDCSRLFIRVGNHCTVIDPTDGQILVRPEITDRGGLLYRREFELRVAYSRDFRRLAISHHLRLNLIDGMTGRLLHSVQVMADPFNTSSPQDLAGLTFDTTGELIFACGVYGSIIVYRAADLTPLASFQWHLGTIRAIAWNSDRTGLWTGGSDGTVKRWPFDRLLTTISH